MLGLNGARPIGLSKGIGPTNPDSRENQMDSSEHLSYTIEREKPYKQAPKKTLVAKYIKRRLEIIA